MRLMNDYIKYWATNNTHVDLAILGGIFANPEQA